MEPLSSATERVVLGNTQISVFSRHRRGGKNMRVFVHNMQQAKYKIFS